VADMTAVRETRTPNELAIQRAAARELPSRPDPWEITKARAVLAALDWVEGLTPFAPLSGDAVEPVEDAVVAERRHAESVEELALSRGLDGTFPGQVGVVLSWFHKRPYTEAPY
jgi:hypothetical protein